MPKTATFKMIDMWLFFASNVLVITMAFHTYLSFIVDKAKKKMDGRHSASTLVNLIKLPKVLKKKSKKSTDGKVNESNQVRPETIEVSSMNEDDSAQQVIISSQCHLKSYF